MSDQAIVFLTHVQSERVFEHFRRLREETSGLLPTLLCIHDPSQLPHFAKRVVAKFQPSAKTIPTPDIKVVDVKSGRAFYQIDFHKCKGEVLGTIMASQIFATCQHCSIRN